MKYLNEKIEVTVPFSQTTEDKVYTYLVSSTDGTIFSGTCFIPKGATSKTFVLNDILQDYYYINSCFINPELTFKAEYSDYFEDAVSFYVTVSIGDGDKDLGSALSDDIYFSNKYPVFKDYMGFQTHLKKWISDYSWIESASIKYNLQGLQNTKSWQWTPYLIPHYPISNSTNYHIIGCFTQAWDIRVTDLQLSVGNNAVTIPDYPETSTSFALPLSTYSTAEDGQNIEFSFVEDGGQKRVYIVGVMDGCPAKYYLQWQDRLGSVQSQPFDGTDTVSFDYETDTIKDSFGEKRVLNSEQTIKWKINTGWINEKLYPFYESIFVSPYLRLYDSENDISYSVLVTDKAFTEKTFANNSHQMFNLTLNLELNKTQKCLW